MKKKKKSPNVFEKTEKSKAETKKPADYNYIIRNRILLFFFLFGFGLGIGFSPSSQVGGRPDQKNGTKKEVKILPLNY